jgi:hypothetical protein
MTAMTRPTISREIRLASHPDGWPVVENFAQGITICGFRVDDFPEEQDAFSLCRCSAA